jgi:hypothetical protein
LAIDRRTKPLRWPVKTESPEVAEGQGRLAGDTSTLASGATPTPPRRPRATASLDLIKDTSRLRAALGGQRSTEKDVPWAAFAMALVSDPWTYQCGKCGGEFKTSYERDQHMIHCGNVPTTKRRHRAGASARV